MKLTDIPLGIVDWGSAAATAYLGETGTATMRSCNAGDIQLRLVDYSAGYLADHWCDKGHILFVTDGALTTEHRDGRRHELAAGMSWYVADDGAAAHRVISEQGATVFIID
jgi:hypothetical protein